MSWGAGAPPPPAHPAAQGASQPTAGWATPGSGLGRQLQAAARRPAAAAATVLAAPGGRQLAGWPGGRLAAHLSLDGGGGFPSQDEPNFLAVVPAKTRGTSPSQGRRLAPSGGHSPRLEARLPAARQCHSPAAAGARLWMGVPPPGAKVSIQSSSSRRPCCRCPATVTCTRPGMGCRPAQCAGGGGARAAGGTRVAGQVWRVSAGATGQQPRSAPGSSSSTE